MKNNDIIQLGELYVNESHLEDSIKKYIKLYINYKFNHSLFFSKITEIHFDIFRKDKDKKYKMNAMTIIELINLAADILDDVQDKDAQTEAPWCRVEDSYNLNIVLSILLICQSKLKNIEDSSGVPQIQETLHYYLLRSLSGQQLDLKNDLVNEEEYIYMNFLKSGSLIALSCFLGTGNIIDNKETKSKIKSYADYLGLIFQLRNDVADMKSGFSKSDLIYKKRTLPILYYLNTADEKYKNIQDYYLNIHSQVNPSIVHEDLLNDDTALLYCSIVENIFIRKYQDTVIKLGLPEKDEAKLRSIISF